MNLKRNSLIYLIGEVISRLIPFIMMPYLTRVLGTDGFGQVSLYLAWGSLFVICISYMQESCIVRYTFYYGKRSLHFLLMTGRIYSIVITIFFLIFSLIIKNEFFFFVVLYAFTSYLLKVELILRQALNQVFSYIAIQLTFSLSVSIFTIGLLELFGYTAELRVFAIIISNIISYFLAIIFFKSPIKLSRKPSFRISKLMLFYILSFASPLLINSACSFIKGQFDRIFIADLFTIEELGVYTAAFQLSSVVLLLVLAMSRTLEPYLYQRIKNNQVSFVKLLKFSIYFIPVVVIISILVEFIPEKLYLILLGDSYIGIKGFILPFVLSFSLLGIYTLFSIYLSYFGKTILIMKSNIVSALIYFICLFLFSKIGIEYIAFSTLISNLVLLVISGYYSYLISIRAII
ncbi:oligosaccharide flippase family protein [Aliivibrio fischeri]|nr:oligosaccharide flippase family protein [Aliivibrio fischeri]